MRHYNVSPHTLARRGTSFTLHFRSICLPGSGVFQNLTEAQRKALKNLCLLTLNKKQRAKAGRMQKSRLAGEGRTWQIFMANHCGVRWMAYKEHAELCTLWRSASVECSWAVWTSFVFFFPSLFIPPVEYQSGLLRHDGRFSWSSLCWWVEGLSDCWTTSCSAGQLWL